MDKKSIEEFRGKSNAVVKQIEELLLEIKKYRSAQESFQTATDMLEDIARRQGEVAEKIEEYVGGLYKMDTEEVIEKMTENGNKLGKITERILEIEERLEKLEKR